MPARLGATKLNYISTNGTNGTNQTSSDSFFDDDFDDWNDDTTDLDDLLESGELGDSDGGNAAVFCGLAGHIGAQNPVNNRVITSDGPETKRRRHDSG